ncbi:MAG: hypothetical protein ACUVT0_01095 [Thermochromatium sp.]
MNLLMIIGLVGTPIAGTQFGLDYGRAIWDLPQVEWTPVEMALPLEQTSESFQLLLDNEPLANHLARNSLTALGSEGLAYFVTPEMVRVRLNNWPQIQARKAQLLHMAVYSALGLGVSLTCLIVGLIEFFRQTPAPQRRPLDGQAAHHIHHRDPSVCEPQS